MQYRKWEPWLFLVPMLASLTLVFGYPVVKLLAMSLHRTSGGTDEFVGLKNYVALFKDDVFLQAAKNNLILLFCVPVMVIVALAIAVLLFERIRGWKFYRAALFLPYLLPITVVGLVFSYIFQLSGMLNEFLHAVGLGRLAMDWLGSPEWALYALMFVVVWKEVGFGIVLFLARLMSVDEELYEAAKIDGANWWQLQWHITLPQLVHVIEFYSVVSVITMLSWVFSYVYVMTGGGPGSSTMVTELYVYQMGFRYNQMPMAAAVSILLLLVTGIFIFLELRLRAGGTLEEAR